jgi:hypothetical protein
MPCWYRRCPKTGLGLRIVDEAAVMMRLDPDRAFRLVEVLPPHGLQLAAPQAGRDVERNHRAGLQRELVQQRVGLRGRERPLLPHQLDAPDLNAAGGIRVQSVPGHGRTA